MAALSAFVDRHGLHSRELCAEILAATRSEPPRSRRSATDNLARIIEATLRLSNRKGFAMMTLRELAGASGLSLGGLYAYIDSKTELAHLIQHQVGVTLGRVLDSALAEHTDPRDQLASAIDTHLLITEAMREWFFFLYMEARHLPGDQRRQAVAMEQASEQRFAEIIERGQAAGLFAGPPPAIAAGLLKAMLQDWYLKRRKHRERGCDIETYARTVIATVQAMLDRQPHIQPSEPAPTEDRP